MSGIYIPGMEMPETCFECPLSHQVRYDINVECCATPHRFKIDLRTAETNRIAVICPLVPVPDHGDLLKVLKTERECVSRDCDRNCGACDLALERDEILTVYDALISMLADPADKE